jgi:hypothetical protein
MYLFDFWKDLNEEQSFQTGLCQVKERQRMSYSDKFCR